MELVVVQQAVFARPADKLPCLGILNIHRAVPVPSLERLPVVYFDVVVHLKALPFGYSLALALDNSCCRHVLMETCNCMLVHELERHAEVQMWDMDLWVADKIIVDSSVAVDVAEPTVGDKVDFVDFQLHRLTKADPAAVFALHIAVLVVSVAAAAAAVDLVA